MSEITFIPDDKVVKAKQNETILDAALGSNLPIAHVCGGKGRCSTCRIMISEGIENCAPRTTEEDIIAKKMGFPPEIRLACQTAPDGDVTLRRLVLDSDDVGVTSLFIKGPNQEPVGSEKYVFILFADIRGFTSFSETLLPYDVIHILRRYFHIMGEVIHRYGGYIDNYMGDGLMALFEADDSREGAIRSIKAGLKMLEAVEKRIRPYFQQLYNKDFRIGIGLHYGLVVTGAIGDSDNKKHTVIGDAVNFASRIESSNKQLGTLFLISEDTYNLAPEQIRINRSVNLNIPGKTGGHTLYEVIRMN